MESNEDNEFDKIVIDLADIEYGINHLRNLLLKSSLSPNNVNEKFPPVVFRHMLYHLFDKAKSMTECNKEIKTLIKQKKLREFTVKLLGKTTTVYCFLDDYLDYLKSHYAFTSSTKSSELFEAYKSLLLNYSDSSISTAELETLLPSKEICDELLKTHVLNILSDDDDAHRFGCGSSKNSPTFYRYQKFTRNQVMCFAIPGIGKLLNAIVLGRQELLGKLNRKKYHEISLQDLNRVSFKKTFLNSQFLVKDLEACQQIQIEDGGIIRLKLHNGVEYSLAIGYHQYIYIYIYIYNIYLVWLASWV